MHSAFLKRDRVVGSGQSSREMHEIDYLYILY